MSGVALRLGLDEGRRAPHLVQPRLPLLEQAGTGGVRRVAEGRASCKQVRGDIPKEPALPGVEWLVVEDRQRAPVLVGIGLVCAYVLVVCIGVGSAHRWRLEVQGW